MLSIVLSSDFIAGTISFFIAVTIVSWIGSILFTGEDYKKHWGLSDDKILKPLSNKKWKTFLIFFIGYSLIFFIIIYNSNK